MIGWQLLLVGVVNPKGSNSTTIQFDVWVPSVPKICSQTNKDYVLLFESGFSFKLCDVTKCYRFYRLKTTTCILGGLILCRSNVWSSTRPYRVSCIWGASSLNFLMSIAFQASCLESLSRDCPLTVTKPSFVITFWSKEMSPMSK